jgi:AraC-like DNA-binding protein
MRFLNRAPSRPLAPFVESIWLFENDSLPDGFERILPTGRAQLIVNLAEDETRCYRPDEGMRCEVSSGTILAGVQSKASVIDAAEQRHVMGVSFKPGGTVAFMRMPAYQTSDIDVPLDELWERRRAATLRERLLEAPGPARKLDVLEQALLAELRPERRHAAVDYALDIFTRRPIATSMAAVTGAVGLSAKRFIERFKNEVGLTPKRYCRVLRFQQVLARAHRGRSIDWTALAADCGYFDQAHLINDFRAFAGLTPSVYLSARTEFQNHVKFFQDAGAGV